MFIGAIPRSGQRITLSIARAWPDSVPIQIVCSGNLTVERTLAPLNRSLRGNDVTLYSCALGAAAAGHSIPIQVQNEHLEEFGWLQEHLDAIGDDPCGAAAAVVLASHLASALGKSAHPYWRREIDGFRRQWGDIFTRTRERFAANLPTLDDFTIGGGLELLRERRGESFAVISFPPFTKGWGYEAIFKKLHQLFAWPAPEYAKLDDESLEELLDLYADREHWMFAVPERIERFEPHLCGCARTTNRGVPLWFYASGASSSHVVGVRQRLDALRIPKLAPDEDIAAPLTIRRIEASEFNALRSQYLARTIAPAAAGNCFAILAGGKLIGATSIPVSNSSSPTQLNFQKRLGPCIYVLSDFAIGPSKYQRLAKLVLVAMLSREMRAMLEQDAQRRIVALVTTAFTEKPVSMKYRGLFKLLDRKPAKDGEGFALNYAADAGRWSLSEGFELWRKKHSQSRSN